MNVFPYIIFSEKNVNLFKNKSRIKNSESFFSRFLFLRKFKCFTLPVVNCLKCDI
jgi:hypothetical protein